MFRSILMSCLCCTACAATARALPLRPDLELWQDTMTASMHALKSNHFADAVRQCDQAMDMARHFGPHDLRLTRSEVLRAELYLWAKNYAQAERMFRQAIATGEGAVGPASPELVHPLSSLANFYYYVQPHYDRVAALFRRILAIVEHAQPRDDREVIMWSRNLGMLDQQMGDFADAEPLFRQAVALTEKAQPQWLSHELLNQAEFYRAWKKYDRAEKITGRALVLREQALADDPNNIDRKLDVSVALDELTANYLATGALARAEANARRSLAIVGSFMKDDNPDLGPRLALLGEVLGARGKWAEAAEVYRRLVALTEHNLGPRSDQLADVLGKYATALRRTNESAEAGDIEARAAAIRQTLTAER